MLAAYVTADVSSDHVAKAWLNYVTCTLCVLAGKLPE